MWADETGLIATWAGKWLNVPVVVSIAGGELARLDDIEYGLQRGAFSRWIVGRALRGADAVIAACSYTRNLIAATNYRVPDTKIHTISLGVDTNTFHPPALKSQSTAHKLIHVASLVGVKDQATLLRALARLDEQVTLDILGEGSERARLEVLAAELGIDHRVNFLGAVHHLDLPAHYGRAALNVLSSRHEGLGMVTLEAAACGVPTVGTAVGLLPDEPSIGIAVPVGDDAALAEAIADLLNDQNRLLTLGQSAYETVHKRYTIQHTLYQFRELYADL